MDHAQGDVNLGEALQQLFVITLIVLSPMNRRDRLRGTPRVTRHGGIDLQQCRDQDVDKRDIQSARVRREVPLPPMPPDDVPSNK